MSNFSSWVLFVCLMDSTLQLDGYKKTFWCFVLFIFLLIITSFARQSIVFLFNFFYEDKICLYQNGSNLYKTACIGCYVVKLAPLGLHNLIFFGNFEMLYIRGSESFKLFERKKVGQKVYNFLQFCLSV